MLPAGFLLTVASLVLGGALFVVGCVSLGLSSLLATAWYSVHTGQRLLDKVKAKVNQPAQQQAFSSHQLDNKDFGSEKEE